jgi:polysaccharide pyruvyl transferase WcaK-like protein
MHGDTLKELTVGLLWHSISSGNLGVGALTASQISISESAAQRANIKIKYLVMGRLGSHDYTIPGVDVEAVPNMTVKNILTGRTPLLGIMRSCDLVLDISEGDSFADIYGMRRFIQQSFSKLAVLLARRKLILSPQTIGPFNNSLNRFLASRIIEHCDLAFARDEMSFNYLQQLGISKSPLETIDVAFRLPYEKREKANNDGKIRMGINISALLYNGGYTKDNQFGISFDYPTFINRLLNELLGRGDIELHIVPHVFADEAVEDDYGLAVSLAHQCEGIRVPERFCSPSEAKSYISTLDFFVGSRMHACIGAFSSGVPVIPLSYSRKFEGLFNSLDYPFVANGLASSEKKILELIRWGLSERESLRERVARGQKIAALKLQRYEDALTDLYINATK